MQTPAGYTVRAIDVRAIADEDIVRFNAFNNTLKAERRPEEPPTPVELSRRYWQNIPSFAEVWMWAVSPEGSDEIVASAQASFDGSADENKHLLNASIEVRADHRQRGLARDLLGRIVEVADQQGRTLLMGGTVSVVPAGEVFAKRLGADAGLVHRSSELILANVDRELVDRWTAEGPARAPGYSLELIEGPYPEAQYAEICEVTDVMNTAPRDDLDVEDEHLTPEKLAEYEKHLKETGTVRWSMFIRHDESGNLVGFTDTYWQPKLPNTVGQGGTAVHPDHRGFALGKWLKAAMLQKILNERTEATRVLTSNAYSNDAMLGINVALGFKEERSESYWQLPVEQAKTYLGT